MKLDSEDQRTGLIEIMGRANFSGREFEHGFFLLHDVKGAEILPVVAIPLGKIPVILRKLVSNEVLEGL